MINMTGLGEGRLPRFIALSSAHGSACCVTVPETVYLASEGTVERMGCRSYSRRTSVRRAKAR